MKKNIVTRITAIGMAAFFAFAPISASAASLLRSGSGGSQVIKVQSTLKDLGYFTYPKVTGYYGKLTKAAVVRFQKDNGLFPDGIIGAKTRNKLFTSKIVKDSNISLEKKSDHNLMNVLEKSEIETPKIDVEKIGALDWFSKVRYIWDKGLDATVTDVNSGKSFQVKRTFGSNHADVEPLTKEDTNIIKSIWGGFSWERRAVVVKVGDYILAGSMTAMPHAGIDSAPAKAYVRGRSDGYGSGTNLDAVKNNGASGVMDIHFKNSRTHSTNVMQKLQQQMVRKAASYITRIWS